MWLANWESCHISMIFITIQRFSCLYFWIVIFRLFLFTVFGMYSANRECEQQNWIPANGKTEQQHFVITYKRFMVLGDAMASIAMWSAPQFKAHTHILVNTTNKNRSIVKEMQEPLTSPFYWVLFGLMLLFLVRALNSIRAWRFAFMPSTSFIRYSQPSAFYSASNAFKMHLPKYYTDYQGTRHSQTPTNGANACLDAIWCTRVFRFH